MATMNVLNATGGTEAVEKPLAPGRAAATSSRPVVLSTEDLAAINALGTLLTTISGNVDGLEALLTAIGNNTDGLEGFTDGIETLLGTGNTSLANILNAVDGLEGLVDGLETLIGSTNTKLDSLITQGSSTAAVPVAQADEYETVAASATDQVLGGAGATGDRLAGIIVQPTSTTRGAVTIKDGTTTIYTVPAVTVAADLPATIIPLGIKSVTGAWKITTGAGVTAIAIGDFSA